MNDNNSLELVQAILDGINKTIKIIVRKELEARIAELNIKPFMTIEEAAEYLGISVNTLYQYNSKKVIPHQKVGKNTYYLLEDLNEFVTDKRKRVRSNSEIESQVMNKKSIFNGR